MAALTALPLVLAGLAPPVSADSTTPLASPQFTWLGEEFVEFQGHLYFAADNGTSGKELWRTDGTTAGTTLVADLDTSSIHSMPNRMTVAGGQLFFNALESTLTTGRLYAYDGTTVRRINPGSDGTEGAILGTVNEHLLFTTYRNLGSPLGYHSMASIPPGSRTAIYNGNGLGTDHNSSESPAVLDGWAYFGAKTDLAGQQRGWELYRTNGVISELVKDIDPAVFPGGPASGSPYNLVAVGNVIYFIAQNPTYGRELWRTDGTDAGTFRLTDHGPFSQHATLGAFMPHGGKLYYTAGNQPRELWSTDGTVEGTAPVPGAPGGVNDGVSIGSHLVMFTNGEVWSTDGTTTTMVGDPEGGGYAPGAYATATNGRVYFRAGAAPWGVLVWRSDGTEAGTVALTGGPFDAAASGEPFTGGIGVLGSKVIFSSRTVADPSGFFRQLNVIDTTAADATLTTTTSPTITGAPHPDNKLELTPGAWNLPRYTVTYEWLRNGEPTGAASPTVRWTRPDDVGATISSKVTVTALGAPKLVFTVPGVLITEAPAPEPEPEPEPEPTRHLKVKKKPQIKGKAVVGKTLKVKPARFAQSGVKVKYAWLANGKAIKKAKGKKLKLTKKLKGKRIQVRVTATKAGFQRAVVTSKKTKKVKSR